MTRLLEKDKAERVEKLLAENFWPDYKQNKGPGSLVKYRWDFIDPDLTGLDAFEYYKSQIGYEFLIMHEDFSIEVGEILVAQSLPYSGDELELDDLYVFPRNLAWVMAFTHEAPYIGPFFKKHRDYQRLNQKNMQAVKYANY